MEQGTVTITQEEYKELIRKSLRYDMLREIAQDGGYLTDKEKRYMESREDKIK